AGDFNGDGLLDLAFPQVVTSDVSILLGSGNGDFAPPRHFAVGLGPVAGATGDFNDDGRLDRASVNPTTNEVVVSRGAGDTTLQAPAQVERNVVGQAPVALVAGDFNRDARLDLATANHGSGDVSVLLGLGTGSFRKELRWRAGVNPVA